ncbi:EAL domain-containing protein [Sphingomonas sp. A2-49]|uniref:putative bifunctional diguanylate cyclase/phosphodiesterase n=1 Tax=Sphingomonas sp. A2-49 TaxID=1391375 RepID=UPI0021D00822|nr:EAL domain-containing protein [Sphingomonas sp. A2-49]MCU6455758.1 EAL domain-containing protein [Sphingomonas sp. A2-49]
MTQRVARTPTNADIARRAILPVLGLRENEGEVDAQAHAARLAEVAAIWPLALAAQALAGAILFAAACAMPAAASPIHMAIVAAIATLPALVSYAALATARLRGQPPHVRIRLLTLAASGIAAALLSLVWQSIELPVGPLQIGCFVAAAGAIGLTVVALNPIRIATFGFAVGLVLILPILSGGMLPSLIAALFLAGLAVATLRLARRDADAARALAQEASEGRLAAKMIAEFEGHGTGWFWESDRHGRLSYISGKVAVALRSGGVEPVGRPLTDLFRMDSVTPGTERTLAFHLSSRTSFSDYTVCAADTAAPDVEPDRWWSISGRPVVDELGRFQGFIGSGSDLTEKRKSDAEITRLALFDGLTGLANRQRMRHSLDKTLQQQQSGPYRPASLFLMDLDRFKAVNDTLGHQAGDALLKQVAQRLERVVGDAGLVGRLGGDEFQVLLPGLDNRDTLAGLARELIAGLSQPYFIAGASVSIGCSIGIAIAPHHGEDAEELIRNADLALYAAKADGRGVHRFYSDEMLAGAKSRKVLEDDMRATLGEGGFALVYQPVVSTADARIVGYEALLRWEHPTRGMISPGDFIPVAEDCGLIEAIGEWVLRTACDAAAGWPHGVRVAVNVSPIQFANPAFPTIVASALAHSGLAPQRLELEITEGVFLDESGSTDAMFRALKGLGVRLALDDFGTGYSSLGYLRTAPFDKIKIDQSFVRGAAQPGNRNAAIVRAIVTLADTLGMETTAEGVEIQDEIDLVRDLGCSHIQGFVYGRGVAAADVLVQLGGVQALPVGHKVSRSPRTKMLRSARMAIGHNEGDVRIRNISTSGVMVDGIDVDGEAVGLDVLIELVEDQMFAARIAWAHDGKAGLQFDHPFNLDRLNHQPGRVQRRSA